MEEERETVSVIEESTNLHSRVELSERGDLEKAPSLINKASAHTSHALPSLPIAGGLRG